MNRAFPVELYRKEVSFLFGLFYFQYRIEDRRPDLHPTKHEAEIASLGYKYKHQVLFRFLTFKLSAVIRSIEVGLLLQNDEEVLVDR